ncbi:RraA family protein [Marinilongibacter aquaticus]|uniref:RraA family protein n=1 Tax=Marinilongibacter aquaticus TaxID=2975157 RepID=UPI0021BD0FB2|nr:RraA family protein [Marinilongibacter aquaticus]UBM59392.1 RraA family protein [Marinilongibacter aquaticus]
MHIKSATCFLAILLFTLPGFIRAQTIPREELIFLTSEWKGERFADGRPKVSDNLIERAKNIAIEEAWVVLLNEGYHCQFEGDWEMIHNDVPIAGRALTAQFMPSRPDLEKNIKSRGQKQGRIGNTNSWPIDQLSKGDVYVADGMGKIAEGTLIGDNLGNSIFAKSGNGVVFDGSSRDLEGLSKIEGFNAFVRDWDPSYLKNVVLTGLNTPIRIGKAIVLPGDLVLAKREGVIFIPAHLVEKVVLTAEFIGIRDKFGIEMLKTGKYTPGQIDNQWSEELKKDFLKWLDENPEEIPMKRAELDEYMKHRTW